MNGVLSIGPFTITQTMLAVAASLAGAYLYVRYGTQLQEEKYTAVREAGINVLTMGLITFMFGTAVIRFPLLLSDPLAVLSYPGGADELLLSGVVMAVYSVWQRKKLSLSGNALAVQVFTILIAAEIGFHFLQPSTGSGTAVLPVENHPISAYIITAGAVFLYWLHHRTKRMELQITAVLGMWALSRWMIGFFDAGHTFFMVPVPGMYFWVPAAGAAVAVVFQRMNTKQVKTWKN
ncbi:hypothetical protein [Alkalicoccus urumqiensis]|uniref:Prolipoprotein diacylglyceryl transferase n=1 Tax=Alkalicoccus urumqiensis TaxID=1548213 RepID=A0A2P6MLQ1_ALKUR|nr:hypothetical protein [Alkalicoccus urumqiensis]PRO67188.1 hypothetical protein C6I21_01105 [Alkalicoccus urumqiensis]